MACPPLGASVLVTDSSGKIVATEGSRLRGGPDEWLRALSLDALFLGLDTPLAAKYVRTVDEAFHGACSLWGDQWLTSGDPVVVRVVLDRETLEFMDAPSRDAPPRDAPPRDAPPRDAPPRVPVSCKPWISKIDTMEPRPREVLFQVLFIDGELRTLTSHAMRVSERLVRFAQRH